jgi:hypothetical protein
MSNHIYLKHTRGIGEFVLLLNGEPLQDVRQVVLVTNGNATTAQILLEADAVEIESEIDGAEIMKPAQAVDTGNGGEGGDGGTPPN